MQVNSDTTHRFETPRSPLVLESVLTCPECGYARAEVMPINSCQFFYECTACKRVLKPLAGHCCVFCSYGTVACPPKQGAGGCCT